MDKKTKEDVRDVLVAARNVLDVDDSWTKDALAKDLLNNEVQPHDPHAAQFCMLGAIDFVTQALPESVEKKFNFKIADLGDLAKSELAKTVDPKAFDPDLDADYYTDKDDYYASNSEDIIPAYNDNDRREKEEVIKKFDCTIARLECELSK